MMTCRAVSLAPNLQTMLRNERVYQEQDQEQPILANSEREEFQGTQAHPLCAMCLSVYL